ncbi:MAG: UvrD-helicase domain-containing protein [Opitutales bacterium]|nr:UvrD-helicase domain-containing protein [Opitutales bacterium]
MSTSGKIELRTLIKASAGSGKTFRLTDRFIYLLLCGSEPESIIALTFSRKAAGEFFDAILCKLAEAAKNEPDRARLEKEFGFSITPKQLREKMSLLLGAMNRLTLGTLDSFFFSVLASAPLEYGLAIGFDLMDESSAREKWSLCLRQCFEESIEESPYLIDAFAKARAEAEDREFFPWMLELATSFRNFLTQCPESKDWGAVEQLWPNDSAWKQLPKNYDPLIDAKQSIEWLEDGTAFFEPPLTSSAQKKIVMALGEFRDWRPGADLSKTSAGFKKLFKNAMNKNSSLIYSYHKDYQISGKWVDSVKRMSAYIIGEELKIYGKRTQGIFTLLNRVVKSYNKKVLEKGGIMFSDLPLLLSNSENEVDQLNRDYRLDRKYQHWMLDEFQDTSPSQWGVIEPLLEEVLYNPEDERMFFCVGDQKQAIYGWRGGDSRLFAYLENKFSERLEVEDMNESWRSGLDVLGAVNQVFGSRADPTILIPKWNEIWKNHIPSLKTKDCRGNVAWWTSKDEGERFRAIADLLREVDPVSRGWTCAILTQKRQAARELVDFLRRELPGMPVEEEVGSLPARDNGFSQYLLSLLRAAVHPTDQWAIGHLKMCPFMEANSESLDPILEEVREVVYECGFASFVKEWGEKALPSVEPEAKVFVRKRMEEILTMAQSFDQKGVRNIDLFLDFARRTESSKGAMESSIRAMTIHGSKGLTFDMVIMPDLGGGSLRNSGGFQSGNGIELYQRATSSGLGFDWVLAKPKKILQETDPFLAGMLEADEDAAAFESLCKFYVGMTRPARALYLFSEPYNPKSKSKNFIYLLDDTLTTGSEMDQNLIDQTHQLVGQRGSEFDLAYCKGSPDWWKERGQTASIPEKSASVKNPKQRFRKYRTLFKSRPSDKDQGGLKVYDLLRLGANSAKELGTEVHALFEKVEWWRSTIEVSDWLQENGSGFSVKALDIFKRAMEHPEITKLFSLPSFNTEVWRERSFACQNKDKLVQGVFDRVVLKFSACGEIESAEIIDFKTDRLGEELSFDQLIDRHRAQLESYRSALARVIGLPNNKISMILLFTSLPQIFSWK